MILSQYTAYSSFLTSMCTMYENDKMLPIVDDNEDYFFCSINIMNNYSERDIINMLSHAEYAKVDELRNAGTLMFDWLTNSNIIEFILDSSFLEKSFNNIMKYVLSHSWCGNSERQFTQEEITPYLLDEIVYTIFDDALGSVVDQHADYTEELNTCKLIIHTLVSHYKLDINHKYADSNDGNILSRHCDLIAEALCDNPELSIDIIDSLILEGLDINMKNIDGLTFRDLLSLQWFNQIKGCMISSHKFRKVVEILENHIHFENDRQVRGRKMFTKIEDLESYTRLYSLHFI